ncbi:Sedlin N-terminal conserved region [Babesia microti strain RI]|uniref:Sedlin N-terminal conserved region n=1 Tax=Babesia microti (strain RI) TaxID=1133968 RepID=A0A0K3ANA4_BABMR|nr:Sedlin N-terminal conserved region [Babesia microti strain RI]CTQ41204.1 Sedlin N-terminal conserved region [Babesia microti strain RI]|eukprot:XP_012649215.1 Sedlin N-terminal conserved region [Babesia microti strain RI]
MDNTAEVAQILVLIIVGKDDKPIFIMDMSTNGVRTDPPHLAQFVAYQALDNIDEVIKTSNMLFLKQVDYFDTLAVSAYITPGHCIFLLVHRNPLINPFQITPSGNVPTPPSQESIRLFFTELHELYVRQLINPFYTPYHTSLENNKFKNRVIALSQKHLH